MPLCQVLFLFTFFQRNRIFIVRKTSFFLIEMARLNQNTSYQNTNRYTVVRNNVCEFKCKVNHVHNIKIAKNNRINDRIRCLLLKKTINNFFRYFKLMLIIFFMLLSNANSRSNSSIKRAVKLTSYRIFYLPRILIPAFCCLSVLVPDQVIELISCIKTCSTGP